MWRFNDSENLRNFLKGIQTWCFILSVGLFDKPVNTVGAYIFNVYASLGCSCQRFYNWANCCKIWVMRKNHSQRTIPSNCNFYPARPIIQEPIIENNTIIIRVLFIILSQVVPTYVWLYKHDNAISSINYIRERRCGISLLVFNLISHSFAALTCKI